MTEQAFTECDSCDNKYQTKPALYGGWGMQDWFKINPPTEVSIEELHFCSKACVIKWAMALEDKGAGE